WLAYSLAEPLERLVGIRLAGASQLTALAEYRNGGGLVDAGVLRLREATAARGRAGLGTGSVVPRFRPDDDAVVEWRALTVGLIDMAAVKVRGILGVSEEEMPLAKVLEAGTWKLGRELAAELRPATKGPPIEIESDGTVF
ncbi:hypothetical protein HK405_002413, partial [Cladochytrium tenue]